MNFHSFNSRGPQNVWWCGPQQSPPQRILVAFATEVTNSYHTAETSLQKEAPVVPSSTGDATCNLVLSLDPRAMDALHALATRCQHNSHSTHAHPANPGFIATLPIPVPQTPEAVTTHDISCCRSQRHYHSMGTCALDPGSMATLQVFTTWKLEYCWSICTCALESITIASPQVFKLKTRVTTISDSSIYHRQLLFGL